MLDKNFNLKLGFEINEAAHLIIHLCSNKKKNNSLLFTSMIWHLGMHLVICHLAKLGNVVFSSSWKDVFTHSLFLLSRGSFGIDISLCLISLLIWQFQLLLIFYCFFLAFYQCPRGVHPLLHWFLSTYSLCLSKQRKQRKFF